MFPPTRGTLALAGLGHGFTVSWYMKISRSRLLAKGRARRGSRREYRDTIYSLFRMQCRRE